MAAPTSGHRLIVPPKTAPPINPHRPSTHRDAIRCDRTRRRSSRPADHRGRVRQETTAHAGDRAAQAPQATQQQPRDGAGAPNRGSGPIHPLPANQQRSAQWWRSGWRQRVPASGRARASTSTGSRQRPWRAWAGHAAQQARRAIGGAKARNSSGSGRARAARRRDRQAAGIAEQIVLPCLPASRSPGRPRSRGRRSAPAGRARSSAPSVQRGGQRFGDLVAAPACPRRPRATIAAGSARAAAPTPPPARAPARD